MATFELDRLAVEDAKTAILRPLDKGAILVDESTGTEYKAKDNISQTGMSITKMLTDGLLVGAGSGGGGGVGLPGPAGPAGQDGVDGKDGAVGPHGPQGPAGTAGTNGTDGAKGPKGDDGAKGADGATGAHGPKGDKGDTGPRGPAGSGGGTGGLDPVDQAKIDHITITTDINLDDLDEADIYKTRKNINEQDLTKPVVTDPGTYFIQNQNELAIVVPNNIAGAVPTKAVFAINEKGELRTGRTKGSTMVWGPAAGVGPAGPAGAVGPKGPKGDTGAAGPHGAQGPAGVAGPKGDAGDDGSGLFQFDYKVKVGTVDATPSKGYVAFDNVDPSKATKMYFNVKDRRSADMTLFLSAISSGDYINLHDNGDINDFVAFDSTGKGVLAGSVVTVPVSNYSHAGTLRNNERVYIHWERMQDISGLLKSDGSVAMDTGYKPMFGEDVVNKQYVDSSSAALPEPMSITLKFKKGTRAEAGYLVYKEGKYDKYGNADRNNPSYIYLAPADVPKFSNGEEKFHTDMFTITDGTETHKDIDIRSMEFGDHSRHLDLGFLARMPDKFKYANETAITLTYLNHTTITPTFGTMSASYQANSEESLTTQLGVKHMLEEDKRGTKISDIKDIGYSLGFFNGKNVVGSPLQGDIGAEVLYTGNSKQFLVRNAAGEIYSAFGGSGSSLTTPWVNITPLPEGSTFTNPKVLTPATNLDTFKTEGYYENKSKTDLGTVALHYPEDGSLGILKVFADTNLSTKVYQEFMDIKDARFYTRAFDGSTWQQWVLRDLSALKPNDVATVADIDAPKPTAEQLGKIMNLYGTKHLVDKMPAHPTADGEYKLKVAAGVATWAKI